MWRIDPDKGHVRARIRVAEGVLNVAIGGDSAWVTSRSGRIVSRIDTKTNSVVATIRLPAQPWGIDVTHGSVWVTLADRDM